MQNQGEVWQFVRVRRVTAAVIVEDDRLFLVRRPPSDALAGLWELPGGKIEPGESPEGCLRRELLEELLMRACVGRLLATTRYAYEHGSFALLAYEVVRTSGFELVEHDAQMWAGAEEIHSLPLAPADIDLIVRLREAGYWG